MIDDEQPKNVTVRLGGTHISEMAHPEIVGGHIVWGRKLYKIDKQGHPVEVTDADKMVGCDCGDQGDSGDCQCNQGRCCP